MLKKYTLETLPEILTAQPIADYLGISRDRVYSLFKRPVSEGGIPNLEIGLSKRVCKQDFIEWIEAQKKVKEQKNIG